MNYRKEIDGLRALAILPVIWLHAGLPYMSGGFLGVDVFFVISGFLITSILVNEFDQNRFSLVRFYERRARRILPALMVVIVATSLVIPFVSSNPQYLNDYGQSILGTILFVSNIHFWQTSGYFGSTSELSPMLHTWSLAVEEQYYIFFPLLLMMISSLGRKVLVSALVAICVISLIIATWGSAKSPSASFYLLPSRAWELMAGALAAIALIGKPTLNEHSKLASMLSFIGLCLVFVSYFTFSPSTLHPSFYTLVPIAGTVLIILFANPHNIVGRLLSTKVLIGVGLISYSLYLWHQPVFALLKKRYELHLPMGLIILGILLTVSLSYLSWRFVEVPFRDKKKFTEKKIFKLSFISIASSAVLGIALIQNLYVQSLLFPDEIKRYKVMLEAHESHTNQVMYNSDCKFWSKNLDEHFIEKFERCSKQHNKAIFVIGGSHGMDLYNAIAMNATNPFIVSVSQGFCRAHRFIGNRKNRPKCQYDDFKQFAKTHGQHISRVVYTQTPDRLFLKNYLDLDKASESELSFELIDEVVQYLSDLNTHYNINVMMIGMLPPITQNPINWNYKKPLDTQFNDIVSDNAIALSALVDNVFSERFAPLNIPYISKFDAFDLNMPSDLIIDGSFTYSDRRHLSFVGEKVFGEKLIKNLKLKGFNEFSDQVN